MKFSPVSLEPLESRIAPATTKGIDIGALNGSDGFAIDNNTANAFGFGREIAHGDFNGDSFDDLLVGAYEQGAGGAAYVIFGGAGPFNPVLGTASLNGS